MGKDEKQKKSSQNKFSHLKNKKSNCSKQNQDKINGRPNLSRIDPNSTFIIGGDQITENSLEKIRKDAKSSDPVILKNYSSALGISFLQIISTLYSGVEPTEILEFINYEYIRFLEILQLMMDDSLPIVSADISIIGNLCSQVNQQIPRSLSHGLKKLRERRGQTNLNSPLVLQEIDVKCLYMSFLLLTGVGEINPKIRSKEKDETLKHYFHRIVTYLLERNEFLTPKLFYMLQKNWSRIMSIINNQIREDNQVEQNLTTQASQNDLSNQLPPLTQTQRKQMMNQEEKHQKSTNAKNSQTIQSQSNQRMDEEGLQFDQSYQREQGFWRKYDHVRPIMSERKKDRELEEQKEKYVGTIERRKPKDEKYIDKYEKETIQYNEQNQKYESQQEDYFGIHNAQLNYNYKQEFTVDRTKDKKIKKTEKKKGNKKENKKYIEKQQQKEKCIRERSLQEEMSMEECQFMMGDGDQNLQRGPMITRSQSGLENFYWEDFSYFESGNTNEGGQSNERIQMENELDRLNVENNNLEFNNNAQNVQYQEQQLQSITNPNRAIRHQNRQIDTLVDMVLRNRQQAIQTIASHIYFQLIVWNVQLRQEKDKICRNLFKQYQK